jgi:hypothetical protein
LTSDNSLNRITNDRRWDGYWPDSPATPVGRTPVPPAHRSQTE